MSLQKIMRLSSTNDVFDIVTVSYDVSPRVAILLNYIID